MGIECQFGTGEGEGELMNDGNGIGKDRLKSGNGRENGCERSVW